MRQRQRPAVAACGDGPLALHLLLERAVVAEAGQGVAQGLGAGPVVGVLEDATGLLESLGRLQDAARQPHGQRPQDERHRRGGRAVGTSSDVPEPQASP